VDLKLFCAGCNSTYLRSAKQTRKHFQNITTTLFVFFSLQPHIILKKIFFDISTPSIYFGSACTKKNGCPEKIGVVKIFFYQKAITAPAQALTVQTF
jgi:hypothetical protein